MSRKILPSKNQNLDAMSMTEKKDFLSMDIIERMIRVEQRVSAHFREFIKYNETEYYKSLTKAEKAKFDNYLRWKKKRTVLTSLLLLLPVVLFFWLESTTGHAVSESSSGYLSPSSWILPVVFIVGISAILVMAVLRKKRARLFNSHAQVIEDFLYGYTRSS